MMTVLIDLRHWNNEFTGVGQVAKNTSLALVNLWKEIDFILIVNPETAKLEELKNCRKIVTSTRLSDHPRTEFLEQILIPYWVFKYNATHFLSFESRVPILAMCKKYTWIHDASIIHYKSDHPKKYNFFLKAHHWFAAQFANHIFVPSSFSKNECINFFGIKSSKLIVSPLGSSGLIVQKQDKSKTIFLSIGVTNGRKNIKLLLEAFALYYDENPNAELHLTGNKMKWEQLTSDMMLSKGICFLGHIDETQLALEYSVARAFIFPSLYEGFGIPILDALEARVPIIASDIPPFREILGETGLWFNANDAFELYSKMKEVMNDNFVNNQKSITEYSWKRCAESFVKVLKKID